MIDKFIPSTDLAVIEVTDDGLIVLGMVDGLDRATPRAKTRATLTFPDEQTGTNGDRR